MGQSQAQIRASRKKRVIKVRGDSSKSGATSTNRNVTVKNIGKSPSARNNSFTASKNAAANKAPVNKENPFKSNTSSFVNDNALKQSNSKFSALPGKDLTPKKDGKLVSGVKQIFENTIGATGQANLQDKTKIPLDILAGAGAGLTAIGSAGATIAQVTGRTGVKQISAIGKIETAATLSNKPGIAATIRTNTATEKATATWLSKLVKQATNPAIVISTLMATIGSYPFAGFIKEEALQTLGFASNSALNKGDFASAEEALEAQKEVLDPNLWESIKNGIPFVNVLNSLNNFYQAASLKVDIDERIIKDLKTKAETGETDSEMYARIREERAAQKEAERAADEEYYAEIATQRSEAKAAERAADEKYYANILNNKDKNTQAATEFDDAYWTEYYKAQAKLRDDARPSKLSFGLL